MDAHQRRRAAREWRRHAAAEWARIPTDPATEMLRQALRESAATADRQLLSEAAHAVTVTGGPLDEDGYRWPVRLIRVGESANRGQATGLPLYYTADALRASVHVFEGAKSYMDHPSRTETVDLPERSIDRVAGWISEVVYADTDDGGELRGVWNVVDDGLRAKIRNSHKLGKPELFGFSINGVIGHTERGSKGGRDVELVTAIVRADSGHEPSVDVVTQPAAGGGFLSRLSESFRGAKGDNMKTWAELLAASPQMAAILLGAPNDEVARGFLTESKASDELVTAVLAERARVKLAETAKPAPVAESKAEHEPLKAATLPCGCGKTLEEGAKFCSGCGAPAMAATESKAAKDDKPSELAAAVAESKRVLAEAQRTVAALTAERNKAALESALRESRLDALTIADLRPELEKREPGQWQPLIEARRSYLAARESAPVAFPTGTLRDGGGARIGDDKIAKMEAGMLGWMSGSDEKTAGGTPVERFRSLREAYQVWTDSTRSPLPLDFLAACKGSGFAMGGFRNGQHSTFRLSESRNVVPIRESWGGQYLRETASTSTFGDFWADLAYKRMMQSYHSVNDAAEWEGLASDREEHDNFLSVRYQNLGEYENPSSVAEGGPYLAATTPGDWAESAALTKYGFFETVRMEALLNEEGKWLRTLPDRLIAAAKRLYRETIINAITTTNGNMYDAVALYHAGSHGNLDTTALTITQWGVIERAMIAATASGSSKPLGLINRPAHIVIQNGNFHLAKRVFDPSDAFTAGLTTIGASTELDPQQFKGLVKIHVGNHLAASAGRFWAMADPAQMPTFLIARLRGVKAPEFFAQDAEDSTSMMASDSILWKIRDFFVVKPLEYRSFYQSGA